MRTWTLLLGAVLVMLSATTAWADESAAAAPAAGEPAGEPAIDGDLAPADPIAGDAPEVEAMAKETPADAIPAEVEPSQADAMNEAAVAPEELDAVESLEAAASPEAIADGSEPIAIAGDEESQEVRWDDFEDPSFDPSEAVQAAESSPPASMDPQPGSETGSRTMTARGHTVVLGPMGVDAEGRVGRVHKVSSGDTLWDISEAYLGTPWVWPSVWRDNRDIENPHLINPGDHIWITSTEMRPISEAEAEKLVADAASPDFDSGDGVASDDSDALLEPETLDFEEIADESFPADALDQLPVIVPDSLPNDSGLTGRTVRVSARANMSYVSDDEVAGVTSVVGTPHERRRLGQEDTIYLALGKGEVEVGDQFTLFRDITRINHPHTNALLGYHVAVSGWAEVTEVAEESSVAEIRLSVAETVIGDRAYPREVPPIDIDVRAPEAGLQGIIAFLPAGRTLVADADYVFLDMGKAHGLEIGTNLEVYDPGVVRKDGATGKKVRTPSRVIADLIVVTVEEESSVAFVNHTRRELVVGDAVRGSTRIYTSAF